MAHDSHWLLIYYMCLYRFTHYISWVCSQVLMKYVLSTLILPGAVLRNELGALK